MEDLVSLYDGVTVTGKGAPKGAVSDEWIADDDGALFL
jgi:hypothetical protein